MNNIVLDSIPSNGFGLRKTYEESILYFNVSSYLLNNVMQDGPFRKKLYLSNSGELVVENNNINSKDYREVDIIAFYPYRTGEYEYRCAIEVIDKEILHEHLVSEYEYRRKLVK